VLQICLNDVTRLQAKKGEPVKLLTKVCLPICFVCILCHAQVAQPTLTSNELQFFRFLLMTVGSIDYDPNAVASYEQQLPRVFGLNERETAVIHSAGQEMHTVLSQIRQSAAPLRGKTVLSPSDQATLAALSAERESAILRLAPGTHRESLCRT
jgi:hypothetical protein